MLNLSEMQVPMVHARTITGCRFPRVGSGTNQVCMCLLGLAMIIHHHSFRRAFSGDAVTAEFPIEVNDSVNDMGVSNICPILELGVLVSDKVKDTTATPG